MAPDGQAPVAAVEAVPLPSILTCGGWSLPLAGNRWFGSSGLLTTGEPFTSCHRLLHEGILVAAEHSDVTQHVIGCRVVGRLVAPCLAAPVRCRAIRPAVVSHFSTLSNAGDDSRCCLPLAAYSPTSFKRVDGVTGDDRLLRVAHQSTEYRVEANLSN